MVPAEGADKTQKNTETKNSNLHDCKSTLATLATMYQPQS